MKNLTAFMVCTLLFFNLNFGVFAADPVQSANKTAWPVHLRFVSGPNGGQWFTFGEKIAAVLTSKLLPTSNRIGGGFSNIGDINKKAADIAFTLNCFLGAASSGEAEYAALKTDNVAVLANVYPQVLYFLVRKDFADKHGVKNVEDMLRLKTEVRFASLRPGTASEFILGQLLSVGYDTNFKKLEAQGWTISFSNYAEIADNFAAGTLDAFAYSAGTDVPLIHTIEQYVEIKILPVHKRAIERLADKFKTTSFTIPSRAYQCVKNPVLTVGDFTCLVVQKALPDDLVYAITKNIYENKALIALNTGDFVALAPDTAITKNLSMHPGAKRFWDEQTAAKKTKK